MPSHMFFRFFRMRPLLFCCLCAFALFATVDCTVPGTGTNQENAKETQGSKENQSVETASEKPSSEIAHEMAHESIAESTPDGSAGEVSTEPTPTEKINEPTQESGPIACKNDCDCIKAQKACENNVCADVNRPNRCPSCEEPKNCLVGQPCIDKAGKVTTCPAVACENDCDCLEIGLVCHEKACAPLRRANQCPPCESPQCPPGASCYAHLGGIEKCPGTGMGAACKHDCDCVKFGLLCDGTNGCRALRRLSQCKACTDPTCKSGDPCSNPDKSISKCATSCKHDCDCVKLGQVCDSNGKCASLRRVSLCLQCTDANCKKGDPCLNQDGSFGSCCCSVSGCPQGQVCCSGGAPPPPGICAQFCTQPDPKTGSCPLFP